MPADQFMLGIAELFEWRQDAATDINSPRINRSGRCMDCGRRTTFRRCPRCRQIKEQARAKERKDRRKVQTDGASLHGAGLPSQEPL